MANEQGSLFDQPGQSARNQRRGRQRARTMAGHPSRGGAPLPGAPEGQMFDTGPYTKPREEAQEPGWGVRHGRPNYPGQGPAAQPQATQPMLTSAPIGHRAHPEAFPPGEQFGKRGLSRYVVRNGNGLQFNKPAVVGAMQSAVQGYKDSKYFAHAGMGEALGYTVGIGTTPSHPGDSIRSRWRTEQHEAAMGGNHGVAGENPGYVHATYAHPEGYHSGHPASAFEPGMSW